MMQSFYFGVVPARGGSKRLPGKNLAHLNGRRLLDYTLQAARESRRLSAFVVSTDSDEIAAHARAQDVAVPAMRPARISGDRSPVVDALQHALAGFEAAGGGHADAIVLLQPTSPLRRGSEIDRAIEIFERTGADTVTAVQRVRDHPYWIWREDGERIAPFFSRAEMSMDRSDLPAGYVENGAVYVIRRELVLAGQLYGEHVAPCVMDEMHSLDIDTPLDLAWAEFLLLRGMVAR